MIYENKDHMAMLLKPTGDKVKVMGGDESGVVPAIAYLSTSISLEKYTKVKMNLRHRNATLENIKVENALWFNVTHTMAQRSLAGFPVSECSRKVHGIDNGKVCNGWICSKNVCTDGTCATFTFSTATYGLCRLGRID